MKIGLLLGCFFLVLGEIIILTNMTINYMTTGSFQIQYLGMALVPLFCAILIGFVHFSKKSKS